MVLDKLTLLDGRYFEHKAAAVWHPNAAFYMWTHPHTNCRTAISILKMQSHYLGSQTNPVQCRQPSVAEACGHDVKRAHSPGKHSVDKAGQARHRLHEVRSRVQQQADVLVAPPVEIKLQEDVFSSWVSSRAHRHILDGGGNITQLKPAQGHVESSNRTGCCAMRTAEPRHKLLAWRLNIQAA